MSRESILYKYSYSYSINDSYADVSNIIGIPSTIDVISQSNISFILSPSNLYNLKWNQYIKFNVSITNNSDSIIEDFNIKLIASDNLTYINGTLVNSDTEVYYPSVNWETYYCTTESIPPGKTLNLNYYLMPSPGNNHESYIGNPLKAYNATEKSPIESTNDSYIYLSEQKLVINQNSIGNLVYIENRGTIESSTFTYKYIPPSNTIYSGAVLSGIPFLNILSTKVGKYYLLKIGPLPPTTPKSIKILTIIFS